VQSPIDVDGQVAATPSALSLVAVAGGLGLIASQAEALAAVADGATVSLLVGPEGGFTSCELQRLVDGGAQPVSLGPHRLRVETAAVAMLSACVAALT
jgi:16S rRNA (uracil1498-N3)-methyltransferase